MNEKSIKVRDLQEFPEKKKITNASVLFDKKVNLLYAFCYSTLAVQLFIIQQWLEGGRFLIAQSAANLRSYMTVWTNGINSCFITADRKLCFPCYLYGCSETFDRLSAHWEWSCTAIPLQSLSGSSSRNS